MLILCAVFGSNQTPFHQTRTVQVRQLSDLATEREIHEFFSFSGEIEHVEIRRYVYSRSNRDACLLVLSDKDSVVHDFISRN